MKIAIQGHPTRGKEVIQILESLGGKNIHYYKGGGYLGYYLIVNNNIEHFKHVTWIENTKLYTLEEFEKEFPFKIGDIIRYLSSIGIIKEYCYIDNESAYKIESADLGIIVTMPAKELKPYKEMERNITLTLDKAKEWYKKGGELKEIALQAFSEKELNPLPRSWGEFCKNYPVQEGECWLENCDVIRCASDSRNRIFRNWTPSKKSAEAHLAMIQLEQLRDCWRQGWVPSKGNSGFGIRFDFYDGFKIVKLYSFSAFLSFPTEEIAKEFLECFRDLIVKAGDLI